MFSNYKIEKFYAEIYEFILNKIKDNQNFKSLRINVFGSVYDNSKIFPYWKDFKSINEILEIIKPLDCGQCIFFDGLHIIGLHFQFNIDCFENPNEWKEELNNHNIFIFDEYCKLIPKKKYFLKWFIGI